MLFEILNNHIAQAQINFKECLKRPKTGLCAMLCQLDKYQGFWGGFSLQFLFHEIFCQVLSLLPNPIFTPPPQTSFIHSTHIFQEATMFLVFRHFI